MAIDTHGTEAGVGAGVLPRDPSDRLREHTAAPYLDALGSFAARQPGRYHVPGHKGGMGCDPDFRDALAARGLELDVPLITPGVDIGMPVPPLDRAMELAADAWGAKRTWFLSNGATQGNHAICLALAGIGSEVIVQRNVHGSTIDGLVLSGLRPRWIAPELNPELGIAHCPLPDSLELALADSPGAVGVIVVSPTYYGAVADVRALADVAHSWDVPLIVDEAWGSHFPFHRALPEHALAAGADVVLSGTHKILGSLTQSAMLHLGHGSERLIDEVVVQRALNLVSSTSPNSLLLGSLDAARRNAMLRGSAQIEESIAVLAETRSAIRNIPGLDVLDDRLVRHAGVYDYDPLRLAIDVRATGASGFEIAALLRDDHDLHLELRSEQMLVAIFGLAEPPAENCRRLVEGLEASVRQLTRRPPRQRRREFRDPPRWGALAATPREAFFGRQEVVPTEEAIGRVAAESAAVYPPGIPNVFPGERLTAQTVDFIHRTLERGGTVRGLSDATARTIRVLVGE
jgi:arginine decarboxylase